MYYIRIQVVRTKKFIIYRSQSSHHSHREKKIGLEEFSKALLITGYLLISQYDHKH